MSEIIDDLQYVMTFGRYKGKPLAYVMTNNASYALWAHQNVESFKLSPRLLRLAEGCASSQALRRAADRAWGQGPDFAMSDADLQS